MVGVNFTKLNGIQFKCRTASNTTGLISDGYSKLGVLGIFLIALIFIIIMHFIEFISENKNHIMIKAILIYPILFLINGSLITSFLTGGLIISMILIASYPTNLEDIK